MNDGMKRGIVEVERLVEACQSRDRGAFDELVGLYQQRAMKAAVRVLGDVNEAGEAVQEGFVKAYLNIDKLREPGLFGRWLLKIVANAVVGRLRAGKRRLNQVQLADCYVDEKKASPLDEKRMQIRKRPGPRKAAPKEARVESGGYVGKISIPMDNGKYFIEFMLREGDLNDELKKLRCDKMEEIKLAR